MPTCFAVTSAIAIRIRIFGIYDITSVLGKISRIPSLVQDRFPQPDTGMIAIATHDIADIAIHALRKFGRVIPELPTGCIDNHKQTQLVTGIHESRVLRTVGVTDNLHPYFFQFFGIPPMNTVCDSVSDNRKVLVAVSSNQRFTVWFAIQVEAVFPFKFNATDSDTAAVTVDHISFLIEYPHQQVIQSRCRRSPKHRLLHRHPVGNGSCLTSLHLYLVIQPGDFGAIRLQQCIFHQTGKRFLRSIAHMYLQLYFRQSVRYLSESDKQATSRHLVFIIGISDEHLVMGDQPAIPVDAAKIGIVQHILRLSGRIGWIVAVISPDGNHIVTVPVQRIRHIDHDRQITAKMLRQQFAVHKHLAFTHYGLKMQEKFFALQSSIGCEMLPIPDFPLVIDATARFGRQIFDTVRQRNDRPVFIIKIFCLRTFGRSFIKTPSRIH